MGGVVIYSSATWINEYRQLLDRHVCHCVAGWKKDPTNVVRFPHFGQVVGWSAYV